MQFKQSSAAAVLAFAALAVSSPVTRNGDPQPKNKEFTLGLRAEGYPYLSLNAVHIAAGESQLIFERPSVYPGTPAYLIEPEGYLAFDVGSEYAQGVTFQDVGDNYGTKVPVYANAGGSSGRQGFSINNGTLSARLTSAEQHFFVCDTTVNTKQTAGLFWGVYNFNGTAPYGCTTADVIQSFNVPGGATGSY